MQGKDKNSNLSERKHTNEDLKIMQGWSLERKIQVTQTRLLEWYQKNDNKCYVSFSGGKDSTVLADLAARICKIQNCKLTLWYSHTGLEYPEVNQHVKDFAEWLERQYGIEVNLIIDYPKDKNGKRITFRDVIEKYGYPMISKEVSRDVAVARNNPDGKTAQKFIRGSEYHKKYGDRWLLEKWAYLIDAPFKISNQCCNVMKKTPAHKFNKESGLYPIIGTMACESVLRKKEWLRSGCNAFSKENPSSQPISFWTEQDVLKYLKEYNIPYPSVYGEILVNDKGKYYTTGCDRTGCVFCGYGCHLKSDKRFERLKETHPKLYEYCMKTWDEGGLGMKEVLEFIGVKVE